MEIFISIDGVLRNTIQKFEYHYNDYYLDSDVEGELEDDYDYHINFPIKNDDLKNSFIFQSNEEYENFLYIEFPVEIFGHAGISYPGVFTELHKFMSEHPEFNVTIVGLDQLGKAKPSTLFFLSKNGFLGNRINFIRSENIKDEWKKCDVWVTDNREIIKKCPKKKKVFKFNTNYNNHFDYKNEINKLSELENKLCTTSSENTTISV